MTLLSQSMSLLSNALYHAEVTYLILKFINKCVQVVEYYSEHFQVKVIIYQKTCLCLSLLVHFIE